LILNLEAETPRSNTYNDQAGFTIFSELGKSFLFIVNIVSQGFVELHRSFLFIESITDQRFVELHRSFL
jgi:hypothetical protein